MANTTFTVTDQEYTLVSSGDNILQNKSTNYIRVIYASSEPSIGETAFFSIAPEQALVRMNGVPGGNTYASAESGSSRVVVGV